MKKVNFTLRMKSLKKSKKAFTLIELLIAITIFVTFLVIVSDSFISIIRSQKAANETRQMYSGLRDFMDFINGEMREGTIDYFCYDQGLLVNPDFNQQSLVRCVDGPSLTIDAGNNLRTISKDGLLSTIIKFVPGADGKPGVIKVKKFRNIDGVWSPDSGYEGVDFKEFIFANLNVKNLYFGIYPKKVPAKNVTDLSTQLQPMIEMTLDVASQDPSMNFDLQFQTMITSRAK